MKFRFFLIICSFYSSMSFGGAEASKWNGEILWDSGELLASSKTMFSAKSKKALEPMFLIFDIGHLDFRPQDENFYLDLKIYNMLAIKGLEFRFKETKESSSYFSYTVPLFSDPDFNLLRENRVNRLGISSGNFKTVGKRPLNIRFLQIYYNSTKAGNRIDIIKFSSMLKKLKKGIVSITFDDGYQSNQIAGRITHKFGLKGTAYIMPRQIGLKGYLTLPDLKKLQNINKWDIQFHHATPITHMLNNEYTKEMDYSFEFMKQQSLNKYKGRHLAYPLGKWNNEKNILTKMRFSTARIASGGMEVIPPGDLHLIRTFNILNTTTLKELKQKISIAKNEKQWLILMFHYLKVSTSGPLDYEIKKFEKLMEIIQKSGISNMTMDEVWKTYLVKKST